MERERGESSERGDYADADQSAAMGDRDCEQRANVRLLEFSLAIYFCRKFSIKKISDDGHVDHIYIYHSRR